MKRRAARLVLVLYTIVIGVGVAPAAEFESPVTDDAIMAWRLFAEPLRGESSPDENAALAQAALMHDALRASGRDIVLSLSNNAPMAEAACARTSRARCATCGPTRTSRKRAVGGGRALSLHDHRLLRLRTEDEDTLAEGVDHHREVQRTASDPEHLTPQS